MLLSVIRAGFQPQPLPCPLCVHPTLRALVRGEPVGRDTLAAVNASSFLFERSDAAADEGYFIY